MQSVAFHAQGLQQSIYASKCHMHKNFMHMLWTTKKTVSFCAVKKYICVHNVFILDCWAIHCIFSRKTNLEFSQVFDQWNPNFVCIQGLSWYFIKTIKCHWSFVKAFGKQFNWILFFRIKITYFHRKCVILKSL